MEEKIEILKQIFELSLRNDFTFIVYKLPETEQICLLLTFEDIKDFAFKDLNQTIDYSQDYSFVFAPFQTSEKNPLYLIQANMFYTLDELNENSLNIIKSVKPKRKKVFTLKNELIFERRNEKYADSFERLFKKDDWEKVVLSHYELFPFNDILNLINKFINICKKSKNTFNYLLRIENEIWIGATPEKLLEVKNKEAFTTALAATQKVDENKNLEDYKWNQKDKDEHNFVVDYIKNSLQSYNYKYSKTITKIAGKLAHLSTDFRIKHLNKTKFEIDTFVNQLHPTPAIAGFPKAKAIELINQLEGYDRKYYTGFIGPVNKKNTQLFVNLRCAKLFNHNICFYAGGGIVKASELEKEAEEIKMKINNLKQYFEN